MIGFNFFNNCLKLFVLMLIRLNYVNYRLHWSTFCRFVTVECNVYLVPCWRVHLIPTGYQMEGTEVCWLCSLSVH